jgi:hypothetical protein
MTPSSKRADARGGAGIRALAAGPPREPVRAAWGDADGRTLYMTARTGLYRIRSNVSRRSPGAARFLKTVHEAMMAH